MVNAVVTRYAWFLDMLGKSTSLTNWHFSFRGHGHSMIRQWPGDRCGCDEFYVEVIRRTYNNFHNYELYYRPPLLEKKHNVSQCEFIFTLLISSILTLWITFSHCEGVNSQCEIEHHYVNTLWKTTPHCEIIFTLLNSSVLTHLHKVDYVNTLWDTVFFPAGYSMLPFCTARSNSILEVFF